METWFVKSLVATLTIFPVFIAISFFKFRYGIDPLVFLIWYFAATALSLAAFLWAVGEGEALLPPWPQLIAIGCFGIILGAVANGSLFQAVGLAPNPGLPPAIYATSSLIVFGLSALLASSFPALFKPVTIEVGRLVGIILVLAGLYLLAGGRVGTSL